MFLVSFINRKNTKLSSENSETLEIKINLLFLMNEKHYNVPRKLGLYLVTDIRLFFITSIFIVKLQNTTFCYEPF